jgi:hypothetical protein
VTFSSIARAEVGPFAAENGIPKCLMDTYGAVVPNFEGSEK